MSPAREEVLRRIRSALRDAPDPPVVRRDYLVSGADRGFDVVERFCERVADYDATVHRVGAEGLEALLAERCRTLGARRLVVPAQAPWHPQGLELMPDDPPLSARELDALDGVLSGCALAVADTGTLVLDGTGASGRRAVTLVPDLHLCVVREQQVVAALPEAIAVLAPTAAEGRPLTFVSGPSATSDIEFERVGGVHGPRTLEVFVVQ